VQVRAGGPARLAKCADQIAGLYCVACRNLHGLQLGKAQHGVAASLHLHKVSIGAFFGCRCDHTGRRRIDRHAFCIGQVDTIMRFHFAR
jgi:hypothetical protein